MDSSLHQEPAFFLGVVVMYMDLESSPHEALRRPEFEEMISVRLYEYRNNGATTYDFYFHALVQRSQAVPCCHVFDGLA